MRTRQIRTNDKTTDKQALPIENNRRKGKKGKRIEEHEKTPHREVAIMGEVKKRYGHP